MKHLTDASQRLLQQQVLHTREFRWRSCISCRKISLRGTPNCSTHRLGLTQEEWVVLPKTKGPMFLDNIAAGARWLLEGENDTRNIG